MIFEHQHFWNHSFIPENSSDPSWAPVESLVSLFTIKINTKITNLTPNKI